MFTKMIVARIVRSYVLGNWHAHYFSCDNTDNSLCTSEEKIYSSQGITQHNGNYCSIDIHILKCSVDLHVK